MRNKLILLLASIFLFSNQTPLSAVVNGSEITDADVSKPWVAQIYWAESAGEYNNPEFICTGSLISETKILTAAHCVFDTGFYFVALGARTLNSDAPLLEVESVWRNPRYSDRRLVNDVGVLKLTNPVLNIEPVALPDTSMNKKINKLKKYTVYGWGIDQNRKDAIYLKTASLTNQDSTAKSRMSRYGYSSTTMLAAGNYLKNEKIYAGTCNGDSGGPLVTRIDGVETIIGVTSWGISKGGYCDMGFPSVFSRVTYFLKDINRGVTVADQSAGDNNRAAPSYSVKPSITGSARVGSAITCDTGVWSSNTTNISIKWTSPYGATSITAKSININTWNAGETFTCVVTGSSKTASLPVTSSISIPSKPSSYSYADISGIDSYSTIKSGTVATCSGVKWNSPVESETVQWYSSSSGYSFTPATGVLIGAGSSIALSTPILQSLFGKYLVCSITGTNGGGSATFTDYVSISRPSAPYYVSAGIAGISSSVAPVVGTSATCTGSTSSSYDSMSYEWGYGTSSLSSYTSPLTNSLGTGSTLTITQSIIDSIKGKYLVCVATATNLGGSGSGYATTYITPPVLSVPGAPTIGVATIVSETSATVSFTAPASNGNSTITSYIATSNPGSRTGSISQSGSGTISITGLTPGTSYTFTVTAVTSVGTSLASSPSNVIVTTPAPSNVVAPSQPAISAISATSNSLTVSWNPPASNGGAPISQYWVYVESSPGGETVGSCSTTGALSCTISNLNSGSTYYVIVSAWNSVNGVNNSSGNQSSPRTTANTN